MSNFLMQTNILSDRLYPPACKPYGLEAEPETNIPPFPGPDLTFKAGVLQA